MCYVKNHHVIRPSLFILISNALDPWLETISIPELPQLLQSPESWSNTIEKGRVGESNEIPKEESISILLVLAES